MSPAACGAHTAFGLAGAETDRPATGRRVFQRNAHSAPVPLLAIDVCTHSYREVVLDLLAHLRADSARFRNVLAASDLRRLVPTCPTWTAADLLWHLTEVQWFWSAIVGHRAESPAAIDHERPHRPHDEHLLASFDYHSDRLLTALDGVPPDTHSWTWSSEQSVGWVARRQAHEALIHRIDAEMTAGVTGDVDPELASDGVDEVLRIMIPTVREWATFEPGGVTVRLHAHDTDGNWGVAFGIERGVSPNGEEVEREAVGVGIDAAEPETTITGTASDLDLWLWGRGNLENLEISGSKEPAFKLRAHLVSETL